SGAVHVPIVAADRSATGQEDNRRDAFASSNQRFHIWEWYQMWDSGLVDTVDLLLHPVRVRIVHAFAGGRTLTTADLGERLHDVPKTTLYRQVGILASAGLLEVIGEQRVHGAVERSYRLNRAGTRISPQQAAAMTLDDHRHGFTAATAALLADFNAYLD